MFKRDIIDIVLRGRLEDLGSFGRRLKVLIVREAEKHYTQGTQDGREAMQTRVQQRTITRYKVVGSDGIIITPLDIEDRIHHSDGTMEIRVDLPPRPKVAQKPRMDFVVAKWKQGLLTYTARLPVVRTRGDGAEVVNAETIIDRLRQIAFPVRKVAYKRTPAVEAKFVPGTKVVFIGEAGQAPVFSKLGRDAVVVCDPSRGGQTFQIDGQNRHRTAVRYSSYPNVVHYALTSHLVQQLGSDAAE